MSVTALKIIAFRTGILRQIKNNMTHNNLRLTDISISSA